jgi:hypothetical protein
LTNESDQRKLLIWLRKKQQAKKAWNEWLEMAPEKKNKVFT